MTATIVGILLGFGIGAACRWFDIPSPAPPRLVGALLVVAMTTGFIMTDKALSYVSSTKTNQTQQESRQ